MKQTEILERIKILNSPLTGEIYIGFTQEDKGNGLIISDNKKEVTQELIQAFLGRMTYECEEFGNNFNQTYKTSKYEISVSVKKLTQE